MSIITDADREHDESQRKALKETYRPLPDNLTIKNSDIEGLGLFATEDIASGSYLGISHYVILDYDTTIRTPLGGFYNHSDNPNCKKKCGNGNWFELETIQDIKAGDEITVSYTFYKP